MRMVVVLPEPFGPRYPTISPGCTVKLTRSTAMKSPKCFVRLPAWMAGREFGITGGESRVAIVDRLVATSGSRPVSNNSMKTSSSVGSMGLRRCTVTLAAPNAAGSRASTAASRPSRVRRCSRLPNTCTSSTSTSALAIVRIMARGCPVNSRMRPCKRSAIWRGVPSMSNRP